MKNLSLTTLLILITLGFSSCSQDDSILLEEPLAEDMLKSFNLNKSRSGDYSLDYQLGNGVSADNVLDRKTNTSNIYLYSSETSQTRGMNEDLAIQDGQLKVNFNNTESEDVHSITILDDDIKSSRSSNQYLESYGITGNGDGTYSLNFTVVNGYGANFVYNDDTKAYEIHLNSDATANQASYNQIFTKEEGVALRLEFYNESNTYARSTDPVEPPKPQPVVVVEDTDD